MDLEVSKVSNVRRKVIFFCLNRSSQRAVLQKRCSTMGILLGKLIQFCLAGKMKYMCWETFLKTLCEMGVIPRGGENFFRTLKIC